MDMLTTPELGWAITTVSTVLPTMALHQNFGDPGCSLPSDLTGLPCFVCLCCPSTAIPALGQWWWDGHKWLHSIRVGA